jgi:hypothetical protein
MKYIPPLSAIRIYPIKIWCGVSQPRVVTSILKVWGAWFNAQDSALASRSSRQPPCLGRSKITAQGCSRGGQRGGEAGTAPASATQLALPGLAWPCIIAAAHSLLEKPANFITDPGRSVRGFSWPACCHLLCFGSS